jgi:predicted urease superfamily metal-dependent hydrolase
MENIWKVILGVFISVMIVFSGLGILEANNELMAAEQYLYAAGSEISVSNFAKAVSNAKIEEAKQRSYELDVSLVEVGEGRTKHTAYAVLTMQYPYEIALIHLRMTRTKQIIVY